MNAEELAKANNEKRKQLTKENLDYYVDMIMYIRLTGNKSDQETEEILSELLDHLIEAQQEGKNAEQVFGDQPKQFADEIIGELPKLVTKKRTLLLAMAILYFLAASAVFSGLFNLVSYYLFDFGESTKEVPIGSFTTETLISIPIAFLCLYSIINYLRWSCFKKINKVAEAVSFGIYGIISTGLFLVVFYFIPDFGSIIEIPIYVVLVLGIILYFVARMTRRAI